eukprot:m.117815 g.117815  ORF g.117815 m.117815 type:complete len:793 (+) comp13211_c0_seq4:120-2498(+)
MQFFALVLTVFGFLVVETTGAPLDNATLSLPPEPVGVVQGAGGGAQMAEPECRIDRNKLGALMADCRGLKASRIPGSLPIGTTELLLSGNSVTALLRADFERLPHLRNLFADDNKIAMVDPWVLDGLAVVRMERNPSVCTADGTTLLTCRCASGLSGDGTFCVEQRSFVQVCTVSSGTAGATSALEANCAAKGLIVLPTSIPSTLSALDLRGNQLVHLDAMSLAGLTSLTRLQLDGNRFAAIDPESLTRLSRLTTLTMEGNPTVCTVTGHNRIPVCVCAEGHSGRRGACVKQPRASRVCTGSAPTTPTPDLGTNGADGTTVDASTPHRAKDEVAYCTSRTLVAVPTQISSEAGAVHLSHNSIDYVASTDFSGNGNLVQLFLDNNVLTGIADGAFSQTLRLRVLDLSANIPLRGISALSFAGPLETGVLRSITFDGNPSTCVVSRGHLTECSCAVPTHVDMGGCIARPAANNVCAIDNTEGRVAVECSNRRLALFPIDSPAATTQLSLEKNQIGVLYKFYFDGLDNLEVLSLAMNPLSQVPIGVFAPLQKLQMLDLQQSSVEAERRIFAGPLALTELPLSAQVYLTPASDSSEEDSSPGRTCVRAVARDAVDAIRQKILPLLDSEAHLTTGLTCPLNLFRHRYTVHEAFKHRVGANRRVCQICGKAFRSDDFLDLHMANRHSDVLPLHGTVCPSRYCDVLGCDCSTQCDSRRLTKLVPKCNALMRRCAPNEATFELLSHAYCGNLTCEGLTEICEDGWFGPWYAALLVLVLVAGLLLCSNWNFFDDDERDKRD